MRRALVLACLLTASACSSVDLSKTVALVDVQTGYADLGVINGQTKIVPTALVHIKNTGPDSLQGFQMSASYWATGRDGMSDEIQLSGLVAKDLAPGATSNVVELRANHGFTLDVPRSEAFQNSQFVDFTIKVFGKTGGNIVKLGEFKIDRRIFAKAAPLPSAPTP